MTHPFNSSTNIATKAKFFELWNAGKLGYKLRTWDSLKNYMDDPQKATVVGFREVGVTGGGSFLICNSVIEVMHYASVWSGLGKKFIICEGAPDEKALIQGEVVRTERGLEGFLGASKLRMRDAIAQGFLKPCGWLETEMLLRANMWPSSRNDLDCLLDLYPGHVVEFTCYEHRFEPGRNTIFWEVRNY